MRFAFIAKHRNIWPVAWLCDALDVSRSGFHAWLNRSPCARSRHDEVLVTAIDRSFKSTATEPMVLVASGMTFWPKIHPVACTASRGSARERAACPAAPPWAAKRHRRASGSVG